MSGDVEVRVETYEGWAAVLTEGLRTLYAAVYAEPPYRDGPTDLAEFAAEWPALLACPGFRLVVAGTAGAPVGFALGHVVDPGSGWWPATGPGSPADRPAGTAGAQGDGRSFGIAELGVHPGWRRRGIASRVHEALLAGRTEPRVVLWVHADATAARATYHRWGYRHVGAAPDPPYRVMCLDRSATSAPA